MEPANSLVTQGGLGLAAGVFLWAWLQERKDNKQNQKDAAVELKAQRDKYEAQAEARRLDAVESRVELTALANASTDAMKGLAEKIRAGKKR